MGKWNISVYPEDSYKPVHEAYLDDINREALMHLSTAHKDHIVVLTAMARVRMRIRNGEVIADRPDITVYYDNCSPETQWAWTQLDILGDD